MKTSEMLEKIRGTPETSTRQICLPINPGPMQIMGLPVAQGQCDGKCGEEEICSLKIYMDGYCFKPFVRSAVTGVTLSDWSETD